MEKVYLFKKTGNFTLGIEKVGKKTESGKIKIYDADSKLTKFSVVCKNDLLCKGKVLYPNGDIYNGYLENRKRHGHGTMQYEKYEDEKCIYNGEWRYDMKRLRIFIKKFWVVVYGAPLK